MVDCISLPAWRYNPRLVQPLLDVGAAVDEGPLSLRMRRMLATVVAARNFPVTLQGG